MRPIWAMCSKSGQKCYGIEGGKFNHDRVMTVSKCKFSFQECLTLLVTSHLMVQHSAGVLNVSVWGTCLTSLRLETACVTTFYHVLKKVYPVLKFFSKKTFLFLWYCSLRSTENYYFRLQRYPNLLLQLENGSCCHHIVWLWSLIICWKAHWQTSKFKLQEPQGSKICIGTEAAPLVHNAAASARWVHKYVRMCTFNVHKWIHKV